MGAGKTTIGRALAKRLNRPFFDTDQEIEARTGVTVSLIFEIEGEASFREREREVLAILAGQQGVVVATGGGVVLSAENRAVLKVRGTVIYLRTSIANILMRTRYDKRRPLLQAANPRKTLETLAQVRDPLYREVADFIVESGRSDIRFLVNTILTTLHLMPAKPDFDYQRNQKISTPSPQVYFTIQVALQAHRYPIHIGQHLLQDAQLLGRFIDGKQVAIVTNKTIAPLYLPVLTQALTTLQKQVMTIVLPDGEDTKNWTTLMMIYDCLLAEKCDRTTTLLALGGGVIGDMTGFAAATYMRGVPFVQIPTTLLALVDSSVGGKTAINHPLGKNMIGAFYQPRAVLSDLTVLETLPERELRAGLAEIIKYGAIFDQTFFGWLEANLQKLLEKDIKIFSYAIERSCAIKAGIVQQDERETSVRAILNFGHTFGHAIEAGLGYGVWLHGEAVGCGMMMAADLSWRMGWLDLAERDRVQALIKAAGLPSVAPNFGLERWLTLMEMDKKSVNQQLKFILLKPLGKAVITAVPAETLAATLAAIATAEVAC